MTFVDPLTWSREFSYAVEQERLGAAGVDLVVPADEAERDTLLPRADVVISSGLTRVDSAMIAALSNCVAVQCYSVGMDAVDHDAAAERSIRVANVNASTADVADHTMALVLAMQRRLPAMFEATASDQWDLRKLPVAREIRRLEGQVFGIVGAGRIGRLVATRAQAFGFETIAADPVPPDPPVPGLEIVPIEELFARSDVIAVCASLGETSRHVVNEAVLAGTKPGAMLVNTGRGGLVDERALADAMDKGLIGMAALDVRDPEPPDPGNDLLGNRPNVIQTPHMAAMSERSRSDIHLLVAENVIRMLVDAGRLDASAAGVT